MRDFSIEDTIIAYFDGRLNDSESAELLHRVSVSPEIREQFQEHEMLRQIATRASRNVSVPPHLEEAVFSRITALQQKDKDLLPVGFWSVRRMSVAAAAVALLLTGAIGAVEFGDSSVDDTPSKTGASNVVAMARSEEPASTSSRLDANPPSVSASTLVDGKAPVRVYTKRVNKSVDSHIHEASKIVKESALPLDQREAVSPPESQHTTNAGTEMAITINPPSRPIEIPEVHLPGTTNLTLASLRDITAVDENSQFELGLETSTQFSIPGNEVSSLPLEDFRFHAGYNLDVNDQVGLRLRRGNFERLDVAPLVTPNFTEVTGSVNARWMYSEEVYYERAQPVANGRFWIVGGVGLGFYDAGRLLSADIGVKIPVSEHLLAGFGLALSRLSQYGSNNDILNGHTEPVLYDGPSSRNTINGRLEYGLSYRF